MIIKLLVFILSLVTLSQSLLAIDTNSLKSIEHKYNCENNGERVRLFSNASGNSNMLLNNFKDGNINSKTINSYLGVSITNDIMVVDRLDKKNYFNITLSMCPQSIASQGISLPIISKERRLKSFQASSGILLSDIETSGNLGTAKAVNTYMIAEPYKYKVGNFEGTLDSLEVWTTFMAK